MIKSTASSFSYIKFHYDPRRIVYGASERQLKLLDAGEGSVWKDLCLVAISIFVPTFLNATAELTNQPAFHLTLGLFLNSIFAVISLFFGAGFAFAWRKSNSIRLNVIQEIRSQPGMLLEMLPNNCESDVENSHGSVAMAKLTADKNLEGSVGMHVTSKVAR